jgi:hypothetical protein
MNSIEVGDQPGHAYAIEQIKCNSTKGEYAGVQEKEGTGTEFIEVTGNSSSGHGVFVETFANGDQATFTYQFTGTMKDGKMQSGTNKWQATNGIGKFTQFLAAIGGSTTAAREITDRLEGKSLQRVEVGNLDETPLELNLTVRFSDHEPSEHKSTPKIDKGRD